MLTIFKYHSQSITYNRDPLLSRTLPRVFNSLYTLRIGNCSFLFYYFQLLTWTGRLLERARDRERERVRRRGAVKGCGAAAGAERGARAIWFTRRFYLFSSCCFCCRFPGKPLQLRRCNSDGDGVYLWRQPASLFVIVVVVELPLFAGPCGTVVPTDPLL